MSTFNLEEEVSEYLPFLVGFAYKLARGNPGIPVEDLISAGHFALVKYVLPSYNPSRDTTFSTYAYRPVRFAMLQELRAWQHYQRTHRTMPEDRNYACELTKSPYSNVVHKDAMLRVHRALEKLSMRDRTFLLEAVSTTQKEAARNFGLNEHNASWHFKQALKRLKRVLVPEGITTH